MKSQSKKAVSKPYVDSSKNYGIDTDDKTIGTHKGTSANQDDTDDDGLLASLNKDVDGPKLRGPRKARFDGRYVSNASKTQSSVGGIELQYRMAIDKLCLDVPIDDIEMQAALSRAMGLIKTGEMVRGSTKHTFFKHAYVLKLENGAAVRFSLSPNNPGKGANMQMEFNPAHITKSGCTALITVWKKLFPYLPQDVVARMRIRRIDVCIDVPYAVEDFIIDLSTARAGNKVFVYTDGQGKQQSAYLGSQESAMHGVAYDQDASDQYKQQVGEITSRKRVRDDAELVMAQDGSKKRTESRMRIENRRIFKTAIGLDELASLPTGFGDYRVYCIAHMKREDCDLEFMTYLDSVRFRGVSGARVFMTKACRNMGEVSRTISELEGRLSRLQAKWWDAQRFNTGLMALLQDAPIWKFISKMQRI